MSIALKHCFPAQLNETNKDKDVCMYTDFGEMHCMLCYSDSQAFSESELDSDG